MTDRQMILLRSAAIAKEAAERALDPSLRAMWNNYAASLLRQSRQCRL